LLPWLPEAMMLSFSCRKPATRLQDRCKNRRNLRLIIARLAPGTGNRRMSGSVDRRQCR
jgi:hypothetical protein